MISRSELIRKLIREISPQVFRLCSEAFINEVLYDEVLPNFSDWYPLLCDIKITKDDAIPYKDYNGRIYNFGSYRIPEQFDMPGLDSREKFRWRDIEDYQIATNDNSDVYTGGNFMMNHLFLSSRAQVPHTRSYYIINFREPNMLVVEPPMQVHRNFVVTMQADRTLSTIPRNMRTWFFKYFVAKMKYAIYVKYKYEEGSQTYAGIDIETKIEDFKDAESEIKEIEEEFDKDYMKNPERFSVICLYQKKSS